MSFATSVPTTEEISSHAGLAPFAEAPKPPPNHNTISPPPSQGGAPRGRSAPIREGFEDYTDSPFISQLSTLVATVIDADSGSVSDTHLADFIDIVLSLANFVSSERYIRDVNAQLQIVYDRDSVTVDDYVARTSRSLMVNKRMYMMQKREGDKIRDVCRMILRLTAAFSAVAVASPYATTAPGALLILSVVGGMVAYVLLFIRSASLRRYDDWSKMYWNEEIEPDEDEEEEDDDDSDDICSE